MNNYNIQIYKKKKIQSNNNSKQQLQTRITIEADKNIDIINRRRDINE